MTATWQIMWVSSISSGVVRLYVPVVTELKCSHAMLTLPWWMRVVSLPKTKVKLYRYWRRSFDDFLPAVDAGCCQLRCGSFSANTG